MRQGEETERKKQWGKTESRDGGEKTERGVRGKETEGKKQRERDRGEEI
jgi:hypothetical protein